MGKSAAKTVQSKAADKSVLPTRTGRASVTSPQFGRRNVVFDNAVEVEAARLLERGRGAIIEKMPGFAVVLPLIEFVAGADSDGVFARRYRGYCFLIGRAVCAGGQSLQAPPDCVLQAFGRSGADAP